MVGKLCVVFMMGMVCSVGAWNGIPKFSGLARKVGLRGTTTHGGGYLNPNRSPRLLVASARQLDTIRRFSMDDITFDRYLGQVSYTESMTIEGDSKPVLTEDGAFSGGAAASFTVAAATVRLFQATLADVSIRTKGLDGRVWLREFPASESAEGTGTDLAAQEAAAVCALEGRAFPQLFGKVEMRDVGGGRTDAQEAVAEWVKTLGVAPPRVGATWLIYAYEGDGANTLAAFARPTADRIAAAQAARAGRRSLALPPLPRLVPWQQTARFILAGVIPQALDAIARLHEAGWAHRVLSPSCFHLSAPQGMNKNVAIENCDPSALRVVLTEYGRATLLADAPPAAAALFVAEDQAALGIILLQLLLGALSETQEVDASTGLYVLLPKPPSIAVTDLRRQIALFDARITGETGFSEFCRAEPAWCKVVALLDADGGAGWEFLELLLSAPAAASSATRASSAALGEGGGARRLMSHRFLQSQALQASIEHAASGRVADARVAQKPQFWQRFGGSFFGL